MKIRRVDLFNFAVEVTVNLVRRTGMMWDGSQVWATPSTLQTMQWTSYKVFAFEATVNFVCKYSYLQSHQCVEKGLTTSPVPRFPVQNLNLSKVIKP